MASTKTTKNDNNRVKNEQEAVEKLNAKAIEILQNVDDNLRNNIELVEQQREYPTFSIEEVTIGNFLGEGGFGIVHEITNIKLITTTKDDDEKKKVEEEEATNTTKATNTSTEATNTTTTEATTEEKETTEEKKETNVVVVPLSETALLGQEEVHEEDQHYHLSTARQTMQERCLRNNVARYAIKRLKSNLSPLEVARGTVDLAIEVKFLSVMWHPNIVKMRGYASGEKLHKDNFILLDRLYGTLDDQFEQWKKTKKGINGNFCGCGKNFIALQLLLKEQLTVLYDVASALRYMHRHRLVYRDIKMENIGFDIRGDVKVFDFGLTKCLSDSLKANNNNKTTNNKKTMVGANNNNKTKKIRDVKTLYNLTPLTGAIPYMAPEIMLKQPYNQQCDVFSFTILVWEIMSLKWAFYGYDLFEYRQRVARGKQRLPISPKWPNLIQALIGEGWNHDPMERPTMERIATMIRGDLNTISEGDSAIINRTKHMKDRSSHSIRDL